MARPKSVDGGLERTVAFRLTRPDHEAYRAKFEASGLTQSEFFREHVLANTTTVIARPRASVDKQRLLYLVAKAGNNLNQIAHRAHADHLAGELDEATYRTLLDQLQGIARTMKAATAAVD
ncbi:plasmid mobilization relaxosome protein MobC [Xanthomonas euvesicatoria]|uniref:MobC family plasmid mobilization relaxosome protein n=1 Tax=Xanthomonas euvesicatoria pv. euvesicatoria TaxID=2753541 RepID=A0ABS8LGE4_XANEU|nr:plasmid mobilization relaxosome protein MobC [Xanthomonas euvesicatoria]MCC8633419.1 MobC family plasmid mobilization relaxosome protein [Xanthomonas euvesicatoria pv. euvesicatoria]